MITAFGRFLRNLRMDAGELLLDMAKKLNVSPAFLSGVENGKRKIPGDWVERVSSIYKLSEDKVLELKKVCCETKESIEIGLSNLKKDRKDLVFAFARKLESISDAEIERIRKILNKKEK